MWVRSLVERASATTVVVLGVGAVVLGMLVDYLTGAELSLLLVYVAGVCVIAWRARWAVAVVTALLAASGTLVAQVFSANPTSFAVAGWNAFARALALIGGAWLVANLRQALQRAESRARYDQLTGVANRFAFEERAVIELARLQRETKGLSAAFFDLDGLKGINDRRGHDAGDQALIAFARAVQDSIRATDVFARLGGDEFVLLLPDTSAAEAADILHRVVGRSVEEPARDTPFSVSVGAVTWPRCPAGVEIILRATDTLMYEAKQQGGGRFVHRVLT